MSRRRGNTPWQKKRRFNHPSGPERAQDLIQSYHMVMAVKPRRAWVASFWSTVHSSPLYITTSQPHSHALKHVGFCWRAVEIFESLIHFRVRFKKKKKPWAGQPLSPWWQPDVEQCTSPPLHMQASPEGRVKRHLLPFPPAAAENIQGETKSRGNTKPRKTPYMH